MVDTILDLFRRIHLRERWERLSAVGKVAGGLVTLGVLFAGIRYLPGLATFTAYYREAGPEAQGVILSFVLVICLASVLFANDRLARAEAAKKELKQLRADADRFRREAEALQDRWDRLLDVESREQLWQRPCKGAVAAAGGGPEQLVERIRACWSGGGESVDRVMKDVNKLKQADLQALIRALGQNPGKNKVTENKALVQRLLQSSADGEPSPAESAEGAAGAQIEDGYRRMQELRDASALSMEELRARFAPVRQYPKAVLDGIAGKLGYSFPGGRDEVAEQLLQTLERMRISQMRGEVIKGSL